MSRLTPSLLALDKGLDLQTAKILAPEGSVFDTLNYEQVDFQGQKRIDGFSRYDGTTLAAINEYRVMELDDVDPSAVAGSLIFIGTKLLGVVGSITSTSLFYVIIDQTINVEEGDNVTITSYSDNGSADSWSAVVISDEAGQDVTIDISEHYSNLLSIMSSLRNKVEALPEAIAGLHWFRDRLYAVAGLQTFKSSPAIVGNIPNGLLGQIGSGRYTIIGGTAPYGPVSVVEGQLPPGVTLSADGSYTYDFSEVGQFSWTISVTDAEGNVGTLQDSSLVTNSAVWIVRGTGTAPSFTTAFSEGEWTENQPDGLGSASYLWASEGMLHVSDNVTDGYRYSTDEGDSWMDAGPSPITTTAGRMAFQDNYAYIAAGANALLRRSLPDGQWEVVAVSGAGAASDVAVVGESVLLVYLASEKIKRSVDSGMNFSEAGQFADDIPYTAPRIASDGSRIVVAYRLADGSNIEFKYSDNQGISFAPVGYRFPLQDNTDTPSVLLHDGEYWIAITRQGHVLYSNDGQDWTVSANSLPSGVVQGASALSSTLVGCGPNGLWQTFNHGQTWTQRALASGQSSAGGVAWIGV